MKTRIKNYIYRKAIKVIAKRIIESNNPLTPKILIDRGWIEENGYYIEPNIKDRDRISIKFEDHYYRVWHSDKLTFIALESTVEWFELYFLLSHPDNLHRYLDAQK